MSKKLQMIEKAIQSGLGKLSREGALIVNTGKHTGRAVKDRFIVRDRETERTVNWGKTNQAFPEEKAIPLFGGIEQKLTNSREVFSYEGYVGGFPLQVTSLSAWHIAFAENMFRSEPREDLRKMDAEIGKFRIYHDPYGKVSEFGINHPSETLILLDPTRGRIAIIGTAYAGEIKKSAFSMCNYHLPRKGILTMHASANCLPDGSKTCVLFGLSGTGKTTLSASPDRKLIGDDELIWGPSGIYNLESGCYAKLIRLSAEKEPEIYRACNRFGAILENVSYDEQTRSIDFDDESRTENTRGSYTLEEYGEIYRQDRPASAPETIVFLMADAFGAMPAVARLSPDQAAEHFLAGYTAKVAGTELGVKEPTATFSACFGEPFMPLPPRVYAELLVANAKKAGASFWILNTGWQEGGYGKSDRYPIAVSRGLLTSIQSGELARTKMVRHPVFGFEVPATVKIPDGPAVEELARKFEKNAQEKFGSKFSRGAEQPARSAEGDQLRIA